MRRYLMLFLVLTLALPAAGQEKKSAESAYFPVKIGTVWTYRAGGRTITVRAVKREAVGQITCVRIETTGDGGVHVEHIASGADGVYRCQADGKPLEPPLCVLPSPAKIGQTWKVASQVSGLEVTGSFSLGEAEIVVPAGKYKTLTATSTDFAIAHRKVPTTSWFAQGIGLVKQRIEIDGQETILELVGFEPGK